VANILRSLASLNEAVGDDDELFAAAWSEMISHQDKFLESVITLVGGQYHLPGRRQGVQNRFVPPEKQREAVRYLLGEGAESLAAYTDPDVLYRAMPLGGVHTVETVQAKLVAGLLDNVRLAILDEHTAVDPKAYGVADLGNDMITALWGDLSSASITKKVLQRSFLDHVDAILHPTSGAKDIAVAAAAMQKIGFSPAFAAFAVQPANQTSFPAWADSALPELQKRLEQAEPAEQNDKIHFREMARKIGKLSQDREKNTAADQESRQQQG
jgi:hypothetical protein